MGGVADTQQPGAIPLPEVVDPDRQQFDVSPISQLAEPSGQEWSQCGDGLAKRRQPPLANLLESSFGDHVGDLPVLAAVDQYQDLPCGDATEGLAGIIRCLGDLHPQCV